MTKRSTRSKRLSGLLLDLMEQAKRVFGKGYFHCRDAPWGVSEAEKTIPLA
jgi:hypothetical protein